jgi:hypothetical protein
MTLKQIQTRARDLERTEALVAIYLCPIADDDRQILCEAASGYYYDEIKGFASGAKREALTELGFSTDASAGNFRRQLRVDELGTRAIAKLIIELLARVYDLRTSDSLEYTAPLLSSIKGNPAIADPERCPVPTSSLPRELACQRFWPGTHKTSASPFWFT